MSRWEGEGNEKVWVVDPSTCSCEDVSRVTRVKVSCVASYNT